MQIPTENRESARRAFAVSALGTGITLTALGGDASFRRYFRVQDGDRSFILMDAPPEHGGVALFQPRKVCCCCKTTATAGSITTSPPRRKQR